MFARLMWNALCCALCRIKFCVLVGCALCIFFVCAVMGQVLSLDRICLLSILLRDIRYDIRSPDSFSLLSLTDQ